MNASLKPLASGIVMLVCNCTIIEKSLTLAVGKADSQSLSLRLALADVGGSVPDPAAVAADVGGKLHVRHNCPRLSIVSAPHVHVAYRSGWRRP